MRCSLVVMIAWLGLGCGPATPRSTTVESPAAVAPSPASPPGPAADFAGASDRLGLELWRLLAAGDPDHDLALAPASVSVALAMTYAGARGQTAVAMANTLHLPADATVAAARASDAVAAWSRAEPGLELAFANRLFGAAGAPFEPAFLALTRERFGAELQPLDFAADFEGARRTINAWVAAQTHDRIRELLGPGDIDESTLLVLVDAVYFLGTWREPFDRSRTAPAPFTTAHGAVTVPTMHRTGGRHAIVDGVALLELPYAGDRLAMLIALPVRSEALPAIEAGLDPALLARWTAALRPSPELDVALPRFRLGGRSLSLVGALSTLGMGIAFSPAADLSGIARIDQQLADVVHQVFVEVDERGTEAAAATAVIDRVTDGAPPPSFHADHPFLFFVRDLSTGAIMFMGRVTEPR